MRLPAICQTCTLLFNSHDTLRVIFDLILHMSKQRTSPVYWRGKQGCESGLDLLVNLKHQISLYFLFFL